MSEGYPPALGPPLPDEPSSFLPTALIISMVENAIKDIVDGLNAEIRADADSTHIQANVNFTLTTHDARMSVTQYPDRPNENVVRIPFMVSFDVTGIKYLGVPYFDRKLGQSIEVAVYCMNWFTDQGKILIVFHADKPYLDGLSFSEEALNFFIVHALADAVDSKLRQKLPDGVLQVASLPDELLEFLRETDDCNCLGVTPGTAPTYTDGRIKWKKAHVRPVIPTASDASVTFESIKRLPAHSPSGVLYSEVEDIQLDLYVNHTLRTVQLQGVREGDERDLVVEPVGLGRDALLVLICNVGQLSSSQKDTGFKVFTEETNFGYGTQKIIVTKTYWDQPQRLPDGSLTKPIEIHVNAYEITALIKAPQLGGPWGHIGRVG